MTMLWCDLFPGMGMTPYQEMKTMNTITSPRKKLVSMSDMLLSQFGVVVKGRYEGDFVFKTSGHVTNLQSGICITSAYVDWCVPVVELLEEVTIRA